MANSSSGEDIPTAGTSYRRRPLSAAEKQEVLSEIRQRRETREKRDYGVPGHDYGSSAGYADAVRSWLADYNCWTAFHQQQMNQLGSVMQAQTFMATAAATAAGLPAFLAQQGFGGAATIQPPIGQRMITAQYQTASMIRRIIAEFLDFMLFFILKMGIVYMLIDLELIDVSTYEKLLGNQADLQTLIDVTQDLFPLEVFGKVAVSILEAVFISYGPFGHAGSTPGKHVMRIRVISAHTLVADNVVPGVVTVTGVQRVPFKLALLRSLIKNLLINTLLPLSSVAFAFHHNRAIYDLVSKTMVVEY